MKRVVYAFAVAAMTYLAVSCAQEVYPEDSGIEMTFIATRDKEEDADTRTVLGDNGAVLWSPSDHVSIFKGSGTNGGSKFTSQNSSPAVTVEFKGYLEGLGGLQSGQYYWAIYPYSTTNSCDGQSITATLPANQTAAKGSFPKGCHPAIARTTGTDLRFYAIAGGLEFTVTRPGVKSFSIKGNNGEALAGTYKATFGSDGKPTIQITGAQKEVTLTAPDGSAFTPGEPYVISLLPTTLSKGVTITLITDDNKKGTITSSKSQTVRRSVFGVLIDIDNKAEWESIATIPEAVDLGLSVKWATFNVGATKPEEYGDYFAWGETEPKEDYSWLTYKFRVSGDSYENVTFNKYCTHSSYWGSTEPMDNKTVLDPEDDAATVILGGAWRMPTDAEWTELREKCKWKWTSQNGINGRLVTGPNGNGIFLPAAGCRKGTSLYDVGSYGYYWSSSLSSDHPYCAFLVYLFSDLVYWNNFYRDDGHSVRPVIDYTPDDLYVTGIKLSLCELSLYEGTTAVLTATVFPSRATDKSVMWSSSDSSVATVDNDGRVKGIKVGNTIITATTVDGGYQAKCAVTVKSLPVLTEIGKTFKAIDLGLSIKWASFNLGATKPEEYGDYFAWGETEPKEDYSWSTLKWCNGASNKLTKYCTDSSYWGSSEPMDNKTVLDPEDDAATVILGGAWRMPTDAEWTELREKCKWKWTSQNGINGRLVTGPNGNGIFLPAAGGRGVAGFYGVGSIGSYWSSSLYTDYPNHAYSVGFYSDDVDWGYQGRCVGESVRPVTE